MRGYVDLHCHWVAGIDDGARTVAESAAMLRALHQAGFDLVVATPHMRPALFDNTADALRGAYLRTCDALAGAGGLPEVALSSEHFFDEVVYARLLSGDGLPYPGGRAVLVEFPGDVFPVQVAARFFDLRRRRLRPVLAHPERYAPVRASTAVLDPLLDGGAVLLLDVAALDGKYGRAPRRTALDLLEAGSYQAACSDAHRPEDVESVSRGIARLCDVVGREEAEFLLREGPRAILEGRIDT